MMESASIVARRGLRSSRCTRSINPGVTAENAEAELRSAELPDIRRRLRRQLESRKVRLVDQSSEEGHGICGRVACERDDSGRPRPAASPNGPSRHPGRPAGRPASGDSSAQPQPVDLPDARLDEAGVDHDAHQQEDSGQSGQDPASGGSVGGLQEPPPTEPQITSNLPVSAPSSVPNFTSGRSLLMRGSERRASMNRATASICPAPERTVPVRTNCGGPASLRGLSREIENQQGTVNPLRERRPASATSRSGSAAIPESEARSRFRGAGASRACTSAREAGRSRRGGSGPVPSGEPRSRQGSLSAGSRFRPRLRPSRCPVLCARALALLLEVLAIEIDPIHLGHPTTGTTHMR